MPRLAGGIEGDILPSIRMSPLGCPQPGDHPQQRGLAAARGADEDDELAVVDIEVDARMTSTVPKDLLTSRS